MNPLEQRVAYLEAIIAQLLKSDRYTIQRDIQMFDGRDIQLGLSTGTKIGTATTQKLGFFGHAPSAQYNFSFNASMSGTYGTTEQATLEGIRLALISYGFIHS